MVVVPPDEPSLVPGPVPPRPRSQTVTAVLAALVMVVVAVVLGRQLWYLLRTPSVSLTPRPSPYAGGPANMDAIAAATAPALVDVNTILSDQTQAAGTGMVVGPGGEILTNNHVIEGGQSITVTDVGNGRTYAATVVGYSRSADVAVLQLIGASGLDTVEVGDSSRVRVGDGVVAIGNAHGIGGSPVYSGGYITATNRTVNAEDQVDGSTQTLSGLLETNAAIVSGDSGGALVDTGGKVIGMITAGSAGFRFQAGYGYAIPINSALAVARQILAASPPSGVRAATAPPQYAASVPYFTRGDTSIHYEQRGSGAPLLTIAPGGMRSTIDNWKNAAINPWDSYGDDFRLIAMDQRNAGGSKGSLDATDPWGSYADDQLGLLDSLGVDRFLVMGCCIGGSFILKLIERAPERVVAAVLEQPIGVQESNRGLFDELRRSWAQELLSSRSDIGPGDVDRFLAAMWNTDFVVSVDREAISACPVPLLVLPGVDDYHPTATGHEVARLAPRAEVLEPWKDTPAHTEAATVAVRDFLLRHAGSIAASA